MIRRRVLRYPKVRQAVIEFKVAAGSGSDRFAPLRRWNETIPRKTRTMRLPTILSVLLVAGCYSYHPLQDPIPASGSRVAADLTDAGSLTMAAQVGPGITSIRGEVVESDPDGLLLALTSVLGRNEQESFWKGERVRIPLATVARVQQRRFALGKSMLFGAAAVSGLFAAIKAFQGDGNGGGISGGTGGPSPQ